MTQTSVSYVFELVQEFFHNFTDALHLLLVDKARRVLIWLGFSVGVEEILEETGKGMDQKKKKKKKKKKSMTKILTVGTPRCSLFHLEKEDVFMALEDWSLPL